MHVTACTWRVQVIGPLFTLFDTNAAAAATIPGFDAGVFKSLSNPNPPARAHPLAVCTPLLLVIMQMVTGVLTSPSLFLSGQGAWHPKHRV